MRKKDQASNATQLIATRSRRRSQHRAPNPGTVHVRTNFDRDGPAVIHSPQCRMDEVPGSAVPSPRLHRGDIMSPEVRSALMSCIRGKDTGPELLLARLLRQVRRSFQTHQRDLPGRPDFVFRRAKVAVFVDGCFWHGWRFPSWRLKLSEKWEAKIDANRKRDRRNHDRLRRQGWRVIRIWEHQLEADPDACLQRILDALR